MMIRRHAEKGRHMNSGMKLSGVWLSLALVVACSGACGDAAEESSEQELSTNEGTTVAGNDGVSESDVSGELD